MRNIVFFSQQSQGNILGPTIHLSYFHMLLLNSSLAYSLTFIRNDGLSTNYVYLEVKIPRLSLYFNNRQICFH
jgi:hypothetical protein